MKFYIPAHGETADDAQSIPCAPEKATARRFAEFAADWCHARRNGWEWNWPTTFVVIDGCGNEHRFDVEREMVPEFSARSQPPL